jgi:TIR domain
MAKATPRLRATLYLLGYNVACYKRYEGYREDYDDEDEDLFKRASAYYLKQARDTYKIPSESLAEELGLKLTDVISDDFDPQLEAMHELEGRSATGDFIRRQFGKEGYSSFRLGDYIGGEIGFCHELAKAAIAEASKPSDGKKTLISLFGLKVGEFDEYYDDVPEDLKDVVSKAALEEIVALLQRTRVKTQKQLEDYAAEFFGVYEQLTDHHRQLRDQEPEPGKPTPLYFLSYSHRNRWKADQVEVQLLRKHRRVWRDETDLRAGKRLMSNLYSGIEEADVFVGLLSTTYLKSRYCMEELENAVHRELETGKPRIVVLKIDKSCAIPSIVSHHVWVDAENDAKLALAIMRLVDEE